MATAFQKTYSAKLSEIKKDWWVIDATDIVLGRMSAEVAKLLMGKHKPTYTPHLDCGDNVIIINADKIHLTGKKVTDKTYYWHTNYPGGIKSTTAGKVLDGDNPERVVIKAIERMITRSPLGRARMRNLHVYASAEHPHAAQQPKEFKLDTNPKNSKR